MGAVSALSKKACLEHGDCGYMYTHILANITHTYPQGAQESPPRKYVVVFSFCSNVQIYPIEQPLLACVIQPRYAWKGDGQSDTGWEKTLGGHTGQQQGAGTARWNLH